MTRLLPSRLFARATIHAGGSHTPPLPKAQSNRILHFALTGCLFLYVAAINGALPGVTLPALGQSVWLIGFAESLIQAPRLSLYAHDVGLPEPLPLVFGLPAAVLIALLRAVGVYPADAYSLVWLFWLGLGFWGAYALLRHHGVAVLVAIFAAAVWLSLPVVWQHAGYSALVLGIALMPAYSYTLVAFLAARRSRLASGLLVVAAYVVAIFMDGYSFMMFVVFSLVYAAFHCLVRKRLTPAVLIVPLGAGLAYALYTLYVGRPAFAPANLDFFRAWGADLSFILVPTKGILLIPDLLGLSASRQSGTYFGDSSVYRNTFSSPFVLGALLLFALPFGDRRHKAIYLAIGLGALYMSLGPSFKFDALRPPGGSALMPAEFALGPTGTAVLSKYVPGFNNMRASYRWIALALMGFWAVIMLAAGDRRMPRLAAATILALGIAVNLPHVRQLLGHYVATRNAFVQLDSDLSSIAGDFRQGDIVAFLPYGNDFLANYLAPKFGIRTFNTANDKMFHMARVHWPPELRTAPFGALPSDARERILRILTTRQADAVALSYLDLLLAAHEWPPRRRHYEHVYPMVQVMKEMPSVELRENSYFAIVRLKTDTGKD